MKCSSLIVERNYQNLVSFFFYIGTSHKGSQFEGCRESRNSIFVAKLHISKNEWSLPQSSYDTWKPEPNPITQSAKTDTIAAFSISNLLLSPLQGNLLAPRWPVIVKDRPYITLHVKQGTKRCTITTIGWGLCHCRPFQSGVMMWCLSKWRYTPRHVPSWHKEYFVSKCNKPCTLIF